MNPTVTDFYAKNASEGYGQTYDSQHGARLDAMVEHFKLADMKGKRVVDVGGGLGFLGKRLSLDPYSYYVIDGAAISIQQRLCDGLWLERDLDHDTFGTGFTDWGNGVSHQADICFALEVLEHLSNPYHALVEIKKLVKIGGEVIISIPDETVWHNVVYPGLLWPRQNFEQFLGQMALPVLDFWHFIPKPNGGWPAYHFRCANRPYMEKRMLFPKQEAKFLHATPLEMTNL